MKPSLIAMFRLVPMAVVMGTIFFLSHQPGDSISLYPIPGIDKVAHLFVYTMLACTVILGFSASYSLKNRKVVTIITLTISCLYGLSDEFHQSFIPGRNASSLDLVADFSGAVLACMVWNYWVNSRGQSPKQHIS